MLDSTRRVGLRAAFAAGLRIQQIDVAPRAGRTGRQQHRLIVRQLGGDRRPFAASDYLHPFLFRLHQAREGDIQRDAQRPERFNSGIAIASFKLRQRRLGDTRTARNFSQRKAGALTFAHQAIGNNCDRGHVHSCFLNRTNRSHCKTIQLRSL